MSARSQAVAGTISTRSYRKASGGVSGVARQRIAACSPCDSGCRRPLRQTHRTMASIIAETANWTIHACSIVIPASLAAAHGVVIAGKANAPTLNASRWNSAVPMKANHGSSPRTMTLSAAVAKTLSVAAPKARQCPPTASANGIRMPKWGLTLASPIRIPAQTGRSRSSASPPPISPAVMNPVCPYITLKNTGGAPSAMGHAMEEGRMLRRVSK